MKIRSKIIDWGNAKQIKWGGWGRWKGGIAASLTVDYVQECHVQLYTTFYASVQRAFPPATVTTSESIASKCHKLASTFILEYPWYFQWGGFKIAPIISSHLFLLLWYVRFLVPIEGVRTFTFSSSITIVIWIRSWSSTITSSHLPQIKGMTCLWGNNAQSFHSSLSSAYICFNTSILDLYCIS